MLEPHSAPIFGRAREGFGPEDRPGRPFEPTTTRDLIGLTEAFLRHPALMAVLQRVGVDGDLTRHEEDMVDRITAVYAGQQGWGYRDYLVLAIALALARRVAVGAIPDHLGQVAAEFIADRLFQRTDDRSGHLTNKPTLDEVLAYARAQQSNPDLMSILNEIDFEGSMTKEQLHEFYRCEAWFKRKHGLAKRSGLSVATLLNRYVLAGRFSVA